MFMKNSKENWVHTETYLMWEDFLDIKQPEYKS